MQKCPDGVRDERWQAYDGSTRTATITTLAVAADGTSKVHIMDSSSIEGVAVMRDAIFLTGGVTTSGARAQNCSFDSATVTEGPPENTHPVPIDPSFMLRVQVLMETQLAHLVPVREQPRLLVPAIRIAHVFWTEVVSMATLTSTTNTPAVSPAWPHTESAQAETGRAPQPAESFSMIAGMSFVNDWEHHQAGGSMKDR